jgi:hypothetical protein
LQNLIIGEGDDVVLDVNFGDDMAGDGVLVSGDGAFLSPRIKWWIVKIVDYGRWIEQEHDEKEEKLKFQYFTIQPPIRE